MAEIPVIKPTYQFAYTSDEYITYTVYFINENIPKNVFLTMLLRTAWDGTSLWK